MKTLQKFGLTLVSVSILLGLLLQRAWSLVFRPDNIQQIDIVPAPPDLTPVLVLLSTNWTVAVPLCLMFLAGITCVIYPILHHGGEPELIEIKYVH